MADALGLTSGIIATVDKAYKILRLADGRSGDKSDRVKRELQELEFRVHISLLEEISHSFSSSLGSFGPRAEQRVEDCVKLCHLSLAQLDSLKWEKAKPSDIQKPLQDFIIAVRLLREITISDLSFATHMILREQQEVMMDQHVGFRNYMEETRDRLLQLTALVEESESYGNNEKRDVLIKELREGLQSFQQRPPPAPWQPNVSDPFSFSATIVMAHQQEEEHTPLRGKLDTGCDGNWISTKVLARAKLEDKVEAIDDTVVYTGFGGQEFVPTGKINITWYASNAGVSRETTFFVHEAVPFDMVVGRVFIAEESIFMFNKPALALRQGEFTQDEFLEIEQTARKKKASNEQLAAIRRAKDATAREQKRQQKTASRMSLSPTPGYGTPGGMTPYRTPGNVTPYGQALNPYPRAVQRQRSPSSLSRSLSIQSSEVPPSVSVQDFFGPEGSSSNLSRESSAADSTNPVETNDHQSNSNLSAPPDTI